MRVADIIAATITILWFLLFLAGRALVRGVYLQGPGVAPNARQIDLYEERFVKQSLLIPCPLTGQGAQA